jgi:hypothetical protein
MVTQDPTSKFILIRQNETEKTVHIQSPTFWLHTHKQFPVRKSFFRYDLTLVTESSGEKRQGQAATTTQ